MMKKLLFFLLVGAISQIAFAQNPIPTPNWQLKTEDTYLTIAVTNNQIAICELKNPLQGWNWTPKPTNVPLLNRVIVGLTTYCPNWIYQDAVVDNSNGYTVTLRFTSSSPNLELKSYWRAQSGPGPVENWMTIQNKTGENLTFGSTSGPVLYNLGKNISAASIQIRANNMINLHSFIKNAWWGKEYNDKIGAYANISKNSEFMPYIMFDVGSTHGFYIGYEWELGGFSIQSGSDPLNITASAYPVTEIITQGNNEIFNIPNVYYGTYKGDIDDGSNKFKKWFWNYKITRSLYNNADEPWTVVCIGPWHWSPNLSGNTPQSSYDSIAATGVEMVKLDFWDGTGGCWYTNRDWMYHSKVWPNGFDYAKKAHNAGLKASLYMGATYNDLDLTQTVARDSQLAALLWRYDQGWFDMWRTDQYTAPNEPMPQSYVGIKNFLYIQDYLINNRPGYRYENACNNQPYKGFAICRRMTFCTMVDVDNADVTRSVLYCNSYAINPVQLKTDHSGSTAYNMRTLMLGAILGSKADNDIYRLHISLYKTRQRPILRGGDVYHILPVPDGINWDGLEYFNTTLDKGSVFLFKPSKSAADGDSKVIRLKGLNRSAEYKLVFQDRTSLNCVMTGAQLMENGILVTGMTGDHASEIIWIYGPSSKSKNEGK